MRIRLFCFPFAGGGASVFRHWAADLPADFEVCAVTLPGREDRWWEAPYRHLAPLVEAVAGAFGSYLDAPFAFFGHSMGALIAFELARQLRRSYQAVPIHLFVSAARAPHQPDYEQPIHHLPEPLFLKKLRRYQGVPGEIWENPEFMKLVLPAIRADFALCETYAYSPEYPLDCPISAFGGDRDRKVSRRDVAAWRHETQGPFRLRILPGNHFFLHDARKPLLQAIVQDLSPAFQYLNGSLGT
ncbi:MAG: thioesterase [Acidobacteria bacterium]|nr:thioesterase [Acidobacteriota bacterium]